MDVVTHLPKTTGSGYTGIAVIVDQGTKIATYLHCGKDIELLELARMFSKCVICAHSIRDNIISNHGPQFTS